MKQLKLDALWTAYKIAQKEGDIPKAADIQKLIQNRLAYQTARKRPDPGPAARSLGYLDQARELRLASKPAQLAVLVRRVERAAKALSDANDRADRARHAWTRAQENLRKAQEVTAVLRAGVLHARSESNAPAI